MDTKILVTGATGLVGANVCQLIAEAGGSVRALVRDGSDVEGLDQLGIEVVRGDVTDPGSVRRAVAGADGLIHTAALVAGIWPTSTYEENLRVNVEGTVNVLDAADDGDVPVVYLATTSILPWGKTITEASTPTDRSPTEIPYVTTKRMAFHEAAARAAGGRPVSIVYPGAVYGRSPCVGRATQATSFNAEIVDAVLGRMTRFPPMKLPWVLAEDVAEVAIAALGISDPGARYLALGRPEDAYTIPEFLSLACVTAGADNRVEASPSPREDPTVIDEFGDLAKVADTTWETPYFDSTRTNRATGVEPTDVRQGLESTIAWLRVESLIP